MINVNNLNKNELLESALACASKGWKVLPLHNPIPGGGCSCSKGKECHSVGKHPRTAHASADATTDEAQIREWWSRYPDANVGIATGIDTNLTIVDVDPRNGGMESLQELVKKYGDIPVTPTVDSGGGGFHFYLTSKGYGGENGSPGFVPGIDFKGNKGIIVAPPSLHESGKRYEWQNGKSPFDLALADPPLWLLDLLKESKQRKGKKAKNTALDGMISEGKRNATLLSIGGTLRKKRFNLEQICEELKSINSEKCRPPLDESEVIEICDRVWSYKESDDDCDDSDGPLRRERRNQSTMLVKLADNFELFHTPDSNCYAVMPVAEHFETMNITSKKFKDYLANQFYLKTGGAPSSNSTTEALAILRAKAQLSGDPKPIFIRVGMQIDKTGIDLGTKDCSVIEITADGWNVVQRSEIKFYRSAGMKRLPVPVKGGDINLLRKYLNLSSIEDWHLVVSWLLSTFQPVGPYPILILLGEQGCSKSTMAKVLRSLIDPASPSTRSPSNNEESLLVSARNGWIISLDNLSGLKNEMSDALCRLATGGGLSTRELFTNGEEFLIDAMRPIIINGINEITSQADLLDRAMVITLPVIPPNKRKPEGAFWRDFEKDKPEILGGLFDIVCSGLRAKASVQLESFPRMADFCLWATACEESLGFPKGSFTKAFANNQSNSSLVGLESNPVAQAIIKFMHEKSKWTGTASVLLEELNRIVLESTRFLRYWPQQPNQLSNALTRAAPLLREVGIEVKAGKRNKREPGTGTRFITIEKLKNIVTAVTPSQVLPEVRDDHDDGDGQKTIQPTQKSRFERPVSNGIIKMDLKKKGGT